MTEPIAVIGASQAGLFAAEQLARRGVSVTVYERAERLASATRTLIVTPDLVRALGFSPDEAIVNRVPRFEFRSNGTLARLKLREPDLIVERAALLRLLECRARRAGVKILTGWRFERFERDGERGTAVLRALGTDRVERVRAGAFIGADGARSAVAAALGQPPRPLTSVIQARVALPAGADGGLARVWFAPRQTPYFFWLVPEAGGMAAVGLVEDDPAVARPKLDTFLRAHGLEAVEYQAARIPMYQPAPRPHGRVGRTAIYLVGDAGGQVKVTTIGGTVSGLQGAAAAARAVLSRRDYQRELWPLHLELTVHWAIRRLWSRFGEEEYAALIGAMRGRLRTVLEVRNRDRWAGAMMPALAAQPALLALVAKSAARW